MEKGMLCGREQKFKTYQSLRKAVDSCKLRPDKEKDKLNEDDQIPRSELPA